MPPHRFFLLSCKSCQYDDHSNVNTNDLTKKKKSHLQVYEDNEEKFVYDEEGMAHVAENKGP